MAINLPPVPIGTNPYLSNRMSLPPTGNPPGIKPQGIAKLNPQIVKTIAKMDLQQKSKFDFMIFRNPLDQSGFSAVASVVGMGIDLVFAKIMVQNITFGPNQIVYERINGDMFTKDIQYPDTVTLKCLDDEKGLVMRYLQDWFQAVMSPASITSSRKGYIFADNQEAARRTGILLMNNAKNTFPGTYPRITMYGLVPQSIADITVGQGEGANEPLMYDVTFSVREVRISRFL